MCLYREEREVRSPSSFVWDTHIFGACAENKDEQTPTTVTTPAV